MLVAAVCLGRLYISQPLSVSKCERFKIDTIRNGRISFGSCVKGIDLNWIDEQIFSVFSVVEWDLRDAKWSLSILFVAVKPFEYKPDVIFYGRIISDDWVLVKPLPNL